MEHFFKPKTIGVIGVSRDPAKLGYILAANVANKRFAGEVFFVNPKGGELHGRPVYADIKDIPEPLDLAILLTPPAMTAEAIQACGARGARAAIVLSGGFREVGETGRRYEEDCMQVAQAAGMRLIGPNCIGLVDTWSGLNTTFLPPPLPEVGAVALISQSGAICAAVIDWLRGEGMGISVLASLGNEVDIAEVDVFPYIAAHTETKVVCMYLESLRNGERFVTLARQITQQKPVIVFKAGIGSGGQQAAASHTGALATDTIVFRAAMEKAGVLFASSIEEMFIWARALSGCRLPAGKHAFILTNAGGPGVIAADKLEAEGFTIPRLDKAEKDVLRGFLPPAAAVENPVDMLASGTPQQYGDSLKTLLESPTLDAGMVILPAPPVHAAGEVVRSMTPVLLTHTKPVVVALFGGRGIREAADYLHAQQIPEYRFVEDAASALGCLLKRKEQLEILPLTADLSDLPDGEAKVIIETDDQSVMIDRGTLRELLQESGISGLERVCVGTRPKAQAAAVRMGYPLVMKIDSPDIMHKTDVGGVVLGLASAEAVADEFDRMIERVQRKAPDARINGVTLERMVREGLEVIIGFRRDPAFGPLMMFGSGGIDVEGMKDVAYCLAPLSRWEADLMVSRTWAGRKMGGYRNLPPLDKQVAIDTLLKISALALKYPQIAEMEINPFVVFHEGGMGVDVRAVAVREL